MKLRNNYNPIKAVACLFMVILTLNAAIECSAEEYTNPPRLEFAEATYYSDWHHGRETANGEIYRKELFTCASAYAEDIGRDLVIHYNGVKSLIPCNDRLTNPKALARGVRIDLSRAAVEELTGGKAHSIEVIIERIEHDEY